MFDGLLNIEREHDDENASGAEFVGCSMYINAVSEPVLMVN
jgi:hypothetical protein